SLQQQKDQEIVSLIQQKESELASLEQQKNQELDSLQQQKDQEIVSLIQQKESELGAYKLNLQLTRKELNEIYSSTGYRYLLKPLWDFLWPKKQRFRQLYMKIKNFPDRLKFEFKNKIIIKNKLLKIIPKLTEIYYSLSFRKEAAGVYLNHIKYKTFPLLPKRLTLMIIRRCNLKCRFCDIADVDHRKEILPKEDAFRIIDETNKLGIKEIILTGGEPFLHPDIFEIIDFINLRKIKIIITTNGLFIKQNIEKIANSNIDCISVSIDGKENTHDLLRNRKGAYRQAIEAIQILKGNKINTSVNFVVTNMNIYELEEVYKYFRDLGIKVSFLPVINKPDLFPSKKEERIVYARFTKKLLHQRHISIYEYKYLKTAIEAQLKKNNIYTRCLGLNFELGIDTDANISPCCVWENRKPELNNLGNSLKENIDELWHSPQFHKARVSIFKKGCQDCFNPSIVDLPKIAGIDFLLPVEKTNEGNITPGIKIRETAIRKPTHVHMRFTSRCNLTCRHCDIWKIDKFQKCEISVEEWMKNIDKLHNWLGGFKLDLAGGEVLLYNGTIPLIKYCASKDITVNLTTNSTLIDEAMAEKITNCGLYCINLSLDGLQDSHCYTRNNSGIFLKVHKAAQNLLKYRKQDMPYISLTTVITKYNLKQLPEVVNLTKEWGINNISFQALDQNFSAKYRSDWFKNNEFWPKNFTETEEAINNLIRMKKSGVRIDNSFPQLNAFKRYYKDPIKEINKQCLSGCKFR
ncbi:MAG: radical SAM protein, partial [Candidatus Omnitrophica bacterium]|nr:radical SAM protein [Candidatus Omnitrophota bacterium]